METSAAAWLRGELQAKGISAYSNDFNVQNGWQNVDPNIIHAQNAVNAALQASGALVVVLSAEDFAKLRGDNKENPEKNKEQLHAGVESFKDGSGIIYIKDPSTYPDPKKAIAVFIEEAIHFLDNQQDPRDSSGMTDDEHAVWEVTGWKAIQMISDYFGLDIGITQDQKDSANKLNEMLEKPPTNGISQDKLKDALNGHYADQIVIGHGLIEGARTSQEERDNYNKKQQALQDLEKRDVEAKQEALNKAKESGNEVDIAKSQAALNAAEEKIKARDDLRTKEEIAQASEVAAREAEKKAQEAKENAIDKNQKFSDAQLSGANSLVVASAEAKAAKAMDEAKAAEAAAATARQQAFNDRKAADAAAVVVAKNDKATIDSALQDAKELFKDGWNSVSQAIKDLIAAMKMAAGLASPLIFDFSDEGIKTTSVANGVYFDHAGDGHAEKSAYILGSNGMLVFDINSNGLIDSGLEAFGNFTLLPNGMSAPNGFEALKGYDKNGDGVIDKNDDIYQHLRILVGYGANGPDDKGRLLNLAEAGIKSINLDYENSNFIDANGNHHKQIGSYINLAANSCIF